jgi:tetratricopeptide (TPR) repeat protein
MFFASSNNNQNFYRMKYIMFLCPLILFSFRTAAQQQAQFTETEMTMPTYGFSDPNPVATPVEAYPNMYPYYRFDGYTNDAVLKNWKVVELENQFIKVLIFPEIGGKIWTAIEKKNNQPFLYYNHSVKFRDIAMRGAWTSGGIEFNYGIIGHTPNCSAPVDYLTRKNKDGSVSCFIGALDLITRSTWRVEINLPADKAYFTTNSTWHNASSISRPYYHWANAAIPSAGNLEFIAPGNRYIGHEGETGSWPLDSASGKQLSFYEQNNFGQYKSYHVLGKQADFFGGYWHDKNFGMAHYALKDDKPGKKLFIWGLSEQGMIWQNILSDHDGQYVEVQAGRLFNQNVEASSFTPFKQTGFAPYATDKWSEYWFPVLQTKGISIANPYGSLHVKKDTGKVVLYFSPVAAISDSIRVESDGKLVYTRFVSLSPLDFFSDSVSGPDVKGKLVVKIGEHKISYDEKEQEDTLSRPLYAPAGINKSAHHLYRVATDRLQQRFYGEAEGYLRRALEKDRFHIPSLTAMALLKFDAMLYDSAAVYARNALAIDTYDGAANYYFGLASVALHKNGDARDGFSVATQSVEFRAAAYCELAKICLRNKQYEEAVRYADKSLAFNAANNSAHEIKAICYRYAHSIQQASALLDNILLKDPLNHFARFERYLLDSIQYPYAYFRSLIRNEMPSETILELAITYYNTGCIQEAELLFNTIPGHPEAMYWLAWLHKQRGRPYADLLTKAVTLSPSLIFPFRHETARILEQFTNEDPSWKTKYYLALIYRSHHRINDARVLLNACGTEPDYAPFYITRMNITPGDTSAALREINRAISLDSQNWRYHKLLTESLIARQRYSEALEICERFYTKHRSDYKMGMLYAKTLLLNQQYKKADKVLSTLYIIPFEGATEGHELFREAKLMQAVHQIRQKKYAKALDFITQSNNWPQQLGAGKPYEADIDHLLADYLQAICYKGLGKDAALEKIVRMIIQRPATYKIKNTSMLIKAWVLDMQYPGTRSGLFFLEKEWNDHPHDKTIEQSLMMYKERSFSAIPDSEKDADMRILEIIYSRPISGY